MIGPRSQQQPWGEQCSSGIVMGWRSPSVCAWGHDARSEVRPSFIASYITLEGRDGGLGSQGSGPRGGYPHAAEQILCELEKAWGLLRGVEFLRMEVGCCKCASTTRRMPWPVSTEAKRRTCGMKKHH